ncbi:MAG: S8 family serine peptidase [Deltaproteobacteria bacterium]|nr:S8 family serine peptidase [Deltaproteobacteria bacterium]
MSSTRILFFLSLSLSLAACEPEGFTSTPDDERRIGWDRETDQGPETSLGTAVAEGSVQVFSSSSGVSSTNSFSPSSLGSLASELSRMLSRDQREIGRISRGEVIVASRRSVEELLPTMVDGIRAKAPSVEVTVQKCISENLCLLNLMRDGKKISEGEVMSFVDVINQVVDVRYAEPNALLASLRVPNDPNYSFQWHYPSIFLEGAWDLTTGSADVVGAVIDSGLIPNIDLDRTLPGYDFVSNAAQPMDGDDWDNDPFDDAADQDPTLLSHGTHVAGTMGANTNNELGLAGVDWQGMLLPVRGLGQGGGSSFDLSAAVLWTVGEEVQGVPLNANPADVVNCSFGMTGSSQTEQEAFGVAVQRAIVIAASGNDNVNSSMYPASYPGVISVAAIDAGDVRAPYSNYGPSVDIAAPGGDNSVDTNGDGYPDGVLSYAGGESMHFMQGTSMAAPHVAGVAMLARSLRPNLTGEEFLNIIQATANADIDCPLGCGAGLIDAQRVMEEISGAARSPFSVSPSSLTLNGDATDALFRISNRTDQSASYTLRSVHSALSFPTDLTIPPQSTLAVAVALNRNIARTGRAAIEVSTSTSNHVENMMLQWNENQIAEIENVIVLLVRQTADGIEEASRHVLSAADDFFFHLEAPAGDYFIAAFGDDDNDGSFEEGESVGIYPSNEEPQLVHLVEGEVRGDLILRLTPVFSGSPEAPSPDSQPGVVGAQCSTNDECNGDICLGFAGGYCSADCLNTACPTDSACFYGDETETSAYCLATCTSDSDCRVDEGYLCDADVGVCFGP